MTDAQIADAIQGRKILGLTRKDGWPCIRLDDGTQLRFYNNYGEEVDIDLSPRR